VSQRVVIAEYLWSRLDADGNSAYEVTYDLWRRPASWPVTGRYTYEIWVVAIPRQRSADGETGAESGSDSGEDLKQAIADVAAARVTGAAWKIDDLSEGQAARLIGMPDKLQGLVDEPLRAAAGATGMPDPVAAFSGDVTGTLLLKPVMGPVKKALHGLEIVGAIAGLVTGLHGLSALCLKHLVHDRITEILGDAFSRAISQPRARELDERPSTATGPEAPGRRTRRAPRLSRIARAPSPYRKEPEEPQRSALPGVPTQPRRVAPGTAASRRRRRSGENSLSPAAVKELRSRDTVAWYIAAYHRGTASRG
jgi:hypothetical protein